MVELNLIFCRAGAILLPLNRQRSMEAQQNWPILPRARVNGDMDTWDGERSGVEGARVSVCHGGETVPGPANIHQLSVEEKRLL